VQPNVVSVSLESGRNLGGSVEFERCGPGPGSCEAFAVEDDGTHALVGLAPGTHTFRADLPGGTRLDQITCTGATPVVDLDEATAGVTVGSGTVVSCSFHLAVATVTIAVDGEPEGTRADVGFLGCRTAPSSCAAFVLDDDERLPGGDPDTRARTYRLQQVAAGDYAVTLDELPAGLQLDGIDCVGDGATVDLEARTVSLSLAEVHTVHCTFAVGGASIVTRLLGTGADVTFQGCGPVPTECVDFVLDDDGSEHPYPHRQAEAGIPAGTYTVAVPALPTGVTLTSVNCNGGGTVVDLASRRVTVTMTTQRVWCGFQVAEG
jgi:hypothetical protein